ncbi:MAG TPA: hypothetical protein VHK65_14200 [Candidatus Dormibacteraeota bacterium]|nr:hypothetical protein [Candidatus Dormibacteraeota bacterium]
MVRPPRFGVFLGLAFLIGTGLFAGIAISQGSGVIRVLLTGLFVIGAGLLAGLIALAILLRRHPLMRAYQG